MPDQLSKYKANPSVSFKDEGDEGAVLYNPDTDKCVIINSVGATVWLCLHESKTLEEIVLVLKENYSGIDNKKTLKDLEQFFSSFEEGFIDHLS